MEGERVKEPSSSAVVSAAKVRATGPDALRFGA
jgi:hypothetical protein